MCNVSAMQTPACCTPGSGVTLRGDKCKCGLSRAAHISVLLLELRPQDEPSLRAVVKSIWLAASHPLPLTPSSLLMFSSARKSDLSCIYGGHDLEIKAALHVHLPAFSQRLGQGPDALTQLSVQVQCFLVSVLPCFSACRNTSINSNKNMYLTNKMGIGALTSMHQS